MLVCMCSKCAGVYDMCKMCWCVYVCVQSAGVYMYVCKVCWCVYVCVLVCMIGMCADVYVFKVCWSV